MTWKAVTSIGDRYGRLTVTSKCRSIRGNSYVDCDCDCGTKGHTVLVNRLRKSITRSCGCLRKEVARQLCLDRIAASDRPRRLHGHVWRFPDGTEFRPKQLETDLGSVTCELRRPDGAIEMLRYVRAEASHV